MNPANALVHLLFSGVSVLIVAAFMPGMKVKSYGSAVAFALVVGVLNTVAWSIFGILTVPFAFITLGVGYFVINGLVFLFAKSIVPGVEISGCLSAAIASIGLSVVSSAMNLFLPH